MADHVHLHHVGGAGDAKGHAGGEHDQFAVMDDAALDTRIHGMLEEIIGVGLLLDEHRDHAPAQVQLLPHGLGGRAGDDGAGRAIAGDHPGGAAGLGDRYDGAGLQVVGTGHGGMGDGSRDVVAVIVRLAGELMDIVDVSFRLERDAGHGLYGLHRVGARRGLTREHDGTGSLIDGVGHVGGLRAGGPGIFHHGVQHLRGGDDGLSGGHAFADDLLLKTRYFFQGDFHAHVAAGDHDAVGSMENTLEVLDALHVLNLGDDPDARAALLLEDPADGEDVLCGTGEGGGNEVKTVFDAEDDVLPVLFGDEGHGEVGTGDVDALVVADGTAV